MLVLFRFSFLCLCFSVIFTKRKSEPSNRSVVFPVRGNVYPLGNYSVSLNINYPAKIFDVDIETGSHLTWVQSDASCTGCTLPHDWLYKPYHKFLECVNSICMAIHIPQNQCCVTQNDQCEFEVEYVDVGSTLGMLVTVDFAHRFINGSLLSSRLIFGVDMNILTDIGVLGLDSGKANIVSQLSKLGLTQNVVRHCLGAQGWYVFFRDDIVPYVEIAWIPIIRNAFGKHYSSVSSELQFEGRSTDIKGLNVIFDCGSSYTCINFEAYEVLVNLVKKDLNEKGCNDP